MKHIAWDKGVIYQALDSVFGAGSSDLVKSRTTKTLCNKRTKIENINNDLPTCNECLFSLEKEKQEMGKMFFVYKEIVQ